MKRLYAGGRGLLAFLLILLLLGTAGFAATTAQIAEKTGLAPDLFVQLTAPVHGHDLGIFIVFITDRTFSSRISPKLRGELAPYVGRNALYVNPSVKQVVSSFDFSPERFTITQNGKTFTPSQKDWVAITPGFLAGKFVVNPGGETYGSGSEGILVLGDRIDVAKPFTVSYQGVSATFTIKSLGTTAPTAVATTPTPPQTPAVTPPSQVTNLVTALAHGDFSAPAVAKLIGVDPTLVRTLVVKSRGEELRLLFVRLEASVRASALSTDLIKSIDPLIGSGAVMVWALSPTGADFSPWRFYIQQHGTNYVFFSSSSFAELTPGFLKARRIPVDGIVAGVIKLPKAVDRGAPFAVFYGSAKVEFNPTP